VTNAPFKLTSTLLEKITVNELFYKKIKMVFEHSVWTPLCWGYVGVRRLVTSFCLLICVDNRWGGDDVGSSTQPLLNVPTRPHDFDANARGRHGPNDGNSQPTASAPTGSMGSNTNNKTPRETNNSDTMSDSQCNKKQKQTPSHRQCDSQSSVSPCTHVDFKCVTININGFSEEKWKYILSLSVIQSVSVIILTEHHLSATFRPKELIDSEWNIRSVAGVLKRRSKQHQHRGGVAILYRNTSNLKIEQHRITDGLNGSSHQAVSWTIHSPLIVDPIHITGVYVRPSEGEVEESFHTLTQQDHYPDREILREALCPTRDLWCSLATPFTFR